MVSSNFIQNIQKLGKQISLKINVGDTVFEKNDIMSCTKSFTGDLFKSIMQYVDVELNGLVDVSNQEINIQFGVCMEEPYEYIDWGSFIVDNDSIEKSIDKNTTKFTAYDYLCKSCVDYVDLGIAYPITVKEYLNKICDHLGYTLQTQLFTNCTNTIDEEKFLAESYTFRDVLDHIAGASAGVIIVKGNNLYVKYPTSIDFIIDENNLKSLSLLDKFGPVNSIVISLQPQEDNYYKQDIDSIATYGLTEIKISNNEIMNKNRELFADNILDRLNGLSFYPFELESFGYTFFDPYDVVTIKDLDGNEYKSLILNDTVTVTTGLNEKISTSQPETTVTDYSKATSDEKKLNRTLLEVDKQKQTIKGIVEHQENSDKKIAEFELNLDGIESTVKETKRVTENNEERLVDSETIIQQLSESIANLVTDENGSSLMTQTSEGWTFNIGALQGAVNESSSTLNELKKQYANMTSILDTLDQAVNDYGDTLEYVQVGVYEDEPCIELGESDSDSKLLITNTRIIFKRGSNTGTYIDDSGFVTDNMNINGELRQGHWVWKERANGNYGLSWIEEAG